MQNGEHASERGSLHYAVFKVDYGCYWFGLFRDYISLQELAQQASHEAKLGPRLGVCDHCSYLI